MFYPILQEIFKDKEYMNLDRIMALDHWLGFLPRPQWDKITIRRVSEEFNYKYEEAIMILKELYRYEILDEIYAVICPECSLTLKVLNKEEVEDYVLEERYCYSCNGYFEIGFLDIQIRYRLIKEPDKNPELSYILEVNNYPEIDKLDKETLESFFQKEGTHSFYYNPKNIEYTTLEQLYKEVKMDGNSSNEKGEKFENFIEFLMNRIKPIKASKRIQTETNQLDTFCLNEYIDARIEGRIENVALKKMGRSFICECKNETKSPKNEYFGKLQNILLMSSDEDLPEKFGIIFSMKNAPSTYVEMAKKVYFRNGTVIISLFSDDLDEIVYKRENLLKIIEYKIAIITKSIKENRIRDIKELYVS